MGNFDRIWKIVVLFMVTAAGCWLAGYFIGTSQTIQPISIGFIFFIVVLIFSKDFSAYLFLFILFPFKSLLLWFYEDQAIAALVRDGILILLTMRVFFDMAYQRKQFLPSPISFPIYAFIGYSTAYLLATEKGFIALVDFRSKMLYITVFFLTVHYVNSYDRLKKVVFVMVSVAFFISALGVFQQFVGIERLHQWGIKPRYGFSDPTGYFLVAQDHLFSNAIVGGLIPAGKIAVFFSLCYFHLRKKVPLFIVIALTGITGLIFSFSRATFITMIAGICWLSLFTKWKKLVIVTFLGVFLFFTFTTGWVYDRFEDIFHPFSNTSFVGRLYSYLRAIKGFSTYAFGAGFGRIGGALKGWDTGIVETDTYYVTIFMTIGLPGFLIFMWMGATLFFKGLFVILRMKNNFYRLTAIAAYTYICQQYIAIVTIDSFHTLPTAFYFWVCAGLVFCLDKLDAEYKESTQESTIPEPGTLVPAVQPS